VNEKERERERERKVCVCGRNEIEIKGFKNSHTHELLNKAPAREQQQDSQREKKTSD
jgi:hypothetical protein